VAVVFQNALDEYRKWTAQNPEGYVLNVRGGGKSPMLHRTECGHVFPAKEEYGDFTKLPKVCSRDRDDVEQWARDQGATLALCSTCDV
jgi:hypothetical protein